MKKNAFSLIELLIVISIIAILGGMLLPALNKARMTAKKIQCVSNLKQLGIAVNAYAIDYQNWMPFNTSTSTQVFESDSILPSYYGLKTFRRKNARGALFCPEFPDTVGPGSNVYYIPQTQSVVNYYTGYSNISCYEENAGWFQWLAWSGATCAGKKISKLKGIIAFCYPPNYGAPLVCAGTTNIRWGERNLKHSVHNLQDVYVFPDGRVISMRYNPANNGWGNFKNGILK